MKRMIPIFLFLFITPFLTVDPSNELQAETFSPEASEDIINRVHEKTQQSMRGVSEIVFTEEIHFESSNTKTKEVSTSSVIIIQNKIFPDKDNEKTVISYVKNGESTPPEEYEPGGDTDFYDIFGADGDKYYDYQIAGKKLINGKDHYEVNIVPKEEAEHYFQGNVYVQTEDLTLRRLVGTLADTPFGVQKISLDINYIVIDGISIPSTSTIETYVHIPIVFANKKFALSNSTRDHQVIR